MGEEILMAKKKRQRSRARVQRSKKLTKKRGKVRKITGKTKAATEPQIHRGRVVWAGA